MSRVEMINGIGYSKYSNAIYVDRAVTGSGAPTPIQTDLPAKDFEKTQPAELVRPAPWAFWGDDNLEPLCLLAYIEKCGILNAIIDGKSRFAICEGVVPAQVIRNKSGQLEIVDIVNDPEISDFLEANNAFYQTFAWMKDICGFRNAVARYMLNKERTKIVSFQRDDVTEMRYRLMDPKTGKISSIFLSAAWDRVGRQIWATTKQYVQEIDLLDNNNPSQDLKNKVASGREVEFALTFRYPGWNRKYYSRPNWYSAKEWVDVAMNVPGMKNSIFKNAIRAKYMVLINKEFWSRVLTTKEKPYTEYTSVELEKKKNEFYDQIDEALTGNENAFKAIFSEFSYSPDGKMLQDIEIKTLDDNMPSGEYLPESAVANSEIAFSELFNPGLLGANLPSGPYTNSQGGSSVRESIVMQVIMQELERKAVQRFLSVPKIFNGWNVKHQKADAFFEFIIPATIPATLDTGGSTKPMISSTQNQSPANGAN